MTTKGTPSLDDLRGQARRTYRYWPIYLMLRVREVEQHLTPAQRDELGPVLVSERTSAVAALPSPAQDERLTRLLGYGLLSAEVPLPETLPVVADEGVVMDCQFKVETEGALVSLVCEAEREDGPVRRRLLRSGAAHSADLAEAARRFGEIQTDVSAVAALTAARLWAALHGSRDLGWQLVAQERATQATISDGDERLEAVPSSSPAPALTILPTRRRGRGQFRMPG